MRQKDQYRYVATWKKIYYPNVSTKVKKLQNHYLLFNPLFFQNPVNLFQLNLSNFRPILAKYEESKVWFTLPLQYYQKINFEKKIFR